MRSLRASLLASVTLAASVAVHVAPAAAANPVCADPIPRELCGGRVFAEPMTSATGLTHAQMVDGFTQLAADYPDWVTFEEFGEGSADGNPLHFVEVTSPDSDIPLEDRKIVLVNQSVHGNEPGGREGGTRYLEDLLRGADPEIAGGDEARAALLDRVRFIQTFINPDGWTAGDHDHVQTGGGAYLWVRQNGADPGVSGAGDFGLGTDLNRQAPWRGLIPDGRDPVSQPESQAFEAFVRDLAETGDIQASVDIHGEVPDAGALTMLSSGQFDLDGAMNQRVHGEHVVDRAFADLSESQAKMLTEVLGEYPAAVLHASSEFGRVNVGGSGSGFLGDWIAQPEGGDSASLSTIELYNFALTPGVNSLSARREVMQLYRDTVSSILGALIDQAALEHDHTLVTEGAVAWVDDHVRVADPVRTDAAGDPVVVSAADFFTDLTPQMREDLVRLEPAGVTDEALAGLDSLVVSTNGLVGDAAALAAIRAFAEAGGNVLLTDTGLQLAPALVDGVGNQDVVVRTGPIGLNVYDREHALAAGIRDIAYMNVEAATMGYQVTGSGSVPVWGVASDRWEAAGGTTAATTTAGGGTTSVGEVAVGEGTVRMIGLLVPPPQDRGRILYGINSYGVLDTGFIVMANALDGELELATTGAVAGASAVGDVTVADVAAAPAPDDSRALPAALVLLAGLALTVVVSRRDAVT